MRILSIITSFTTGGAEALVASLSTRFVVEGHEPTVVALCDAAALGNPLASEAAMKQRLAGAGVATGSLRLANRRNPVAGVLTMRRAIAAARPDVIHAHTAQAALILALLRPAAPVVMTHHNSRLSFPPTLFRILDTIVRGYVGISAECTATVERLSRRPVSTIINAADAAFEAPAPRAAPAADPVVISVGAPSRQKNYRTLIRAAPMLGRLMERAGRTYQIHIVGEGEPLPMLRRLAREEGVADRIQLLGARDDVPQLLRAADLYVNCSLWEGLPVAIIEALMTGLPVVATNVAGNRELVRPELNGVLVAPGDPEALADAIAGILLDPVRYAGLSACAWETSRRYSIAGAARAHLDLYARVRAGRAAASRTPEAIGRSA
ncbi:MAG TPA: glycosyltransferase [Sphingomonas sp.]|nr:glycosyltransferase [Sphingomonas sp.]